MEKDREHKRERDRRLRHTRRHTGKDLQYTSGIFTGKQVLRERETEREEKR